MDLINWSLSAIDTIFSTRSLGSGEPVCPDGTFAAGYTRDAWERWQIVCLAALSVEDAEDIYLFGTMITGILLIGLGFTLGYRKIQKTGTAVQSLTRLPVFDWSCGKSGQQWVWDYKPEYGYHHDETRSFGSETWWFQRSEWTKRMSCGSFAAVRPKSHNNLILSFLAPRTGALAKAVWITTLRERWSGTLFLPSSLPRLQTLLPSPIQLPL